MQIRINKVTEKDLNKILTLKGWIKSVRHSKTISFITLTDGSNLNGLQIIADSNLKNYEQLIPKLTTGTAISIAGKITQSPGKEQSVEIQAINIEIIGNCDAENYPLQKKRHRFEFLRTISHLRPRTNTFGAISRVRNALSFATHKFFQEKGFLYINTPIITGTDCEGAGKLFRLTTLKPKDFFLKKNKNFDFSKDFFGKPTYLTVSGQLEAEAYACSLTDIYTFGPTFRAENSNTSRHLAEFWMIEPEMAFADLNDNMNYAQDYIKYCLNFVLEKCHQDMEFFNKFISKGIIERLNNIKNSNFIKIDYTKAIEILKNASKKFEFPIEWGKDLQSEHERYLTEEYFKKPVIIYNYPAQIKAFYMRQNDDKKTVAAMDVLVAGIGEIIGGSQREERLNVLEKKMKELKLNKEDYWWYLELRKYGSVPHSGFGLGFERLVQLVTGMENIRDVIPFPRYPKHCEF